MTINRGIITTGTLFLLGLLVAVPASANPLLSGYGGPGQGSQAILGSALLGGPGGGGGSGGAGGGSKGGGPVGGPAGATVGPRGHASGSSRSSRHPAGGTGKPSSASPRTYIASSRLASSDTDVGTQTLGISGQDLLFILVALGLLAATTALTRQLARRPR
jgi:hypothetical protein